MNTTEAQTVHGTMPETVVSGVAGRSMVEAIGAVGAIILAIIGLAGILSNLMASIATIVIGAGILGEGWAVGSSYRQRFLHGGTAAQGTALSGSLTADFMGGLAGVVLGILAIFRMVPDTFLAVALLVYGATLLLSSLAAPYAYWRFTPQGQTPTQGLAGEPFAVASSGHLLVGLSAVVLGILAIIGQVPSTLILVGLLSLGAVTLFSQFRLP